MNWQNLTAVDTQARLKWSRGFHDIVRKGLVGIFSLHRFLFFPAPKDHCSEDLLSPSSLCISKRGICLSLRRFLLIQRSILDSSPLGVAGSSPGCWIFRFCGKPSGLNKSTTFFFQIMLQISNIAHCPEDTWVSQLSSGSRCFICLPTRKNLQLNINREPASVAS